MNLYLLFSISIFWIGTLGLYSLRNMSVMENFNRLGVIIGFATLIQKTAPFGIIAFLILSVIKTSWYLPFIYLVIGILIGIGLGRFLSKMRIMNFSSKRTENEMLMSIILTCISFYFMLTLNCQQ